ncbi:MFS transporter [Rhodococcoides fascians]|uniref:MFS transporter n=1 Tax=Rhodococcoides fascians TaxID=1828 RepID=UPI0019D3BF9B|nr:MULTISPECIES: MFS transporter [Rhodococcus]
MSQPSQREPSRPLSQPLILLLAVTCGTLVANLYYAQPLLGTIAESFGTTDSVAGVLVTIAQVGYALGLALVLPLGDLVERRCLIVVLTLVCAGANIVAVVSPTMIVLAAALLVASVGASAAMIIVPVASALASDGNRGRTVGTVMSGLFIGILLARTVSGMLSTVSGWRLVYGCAAVLLTAISVALWKNIPPSRPEAGTRYLGILRSVFLLIVRYRALQKRMVIGALLMASFSMLWTGLVFVLTREPYAFNEFVIGLFGLAGLAGAFAAPLAGKLADRGRGAVATTGFLLVLLASWGFLAIGAVGGTWAIISLIVGIVMLDVGVQGAHISNQNVVFALQPDARSRLNTAYMVSYFSGGVIGSLAASVSFSIGRWGLLCAVGAAVSLTALAAWLLACRAKGKATNK